MKVLWISTRLFNIHEETQSGVWLKALGIKLAEAENIILGNISVTDGIKDIERCDFGNIMQWALPRPKINRKGEIDKKTKILFSEVIEEFKPEILQIWGSENPFKLLPFKEKFPGVKVLTMQGVLGSIGPVLLSGLSCRQLIYTIGIREIITRRNLFSTKRSFIKNARYEEEMVKRSKYIITQSEWTDSQLITINPNAIYYRIHRVLRPQFLECKNWLDFEHPEPLLYSAAIGYSLKGLHTLIKALSIIKMFYPNVVLRLAGLTGRRDFLADGYLRLILKLIRDYELDKNIEWLGPITANEIVTNLQKVSVFIQPSFVESYSLTLAEAMSVGTPSVVSFAGAMPELAENNKEALFFTPGDYKRCAYLTIKLLSDKELAKEISLNAVKKAKARNIETDIVKQQIDIYNDILRKESHELK